MIKIALVAVLSLASWGCKKKEAAADCAAALDNAMKVSKDELAKANFDDAAVAKIKAASMGSCLQDKWAGDVRQCLADAKTAGDVTGCQNKMTRDQQDSLARAVTGATAAPAPDPEATDLAPPTLGDSGLPATCEGYKTLIDKLATCESLPHASREAMLQTFSAMAKGFAAGSTPEATQTLATACQQATDALQPSAAACGL